MAVQDVRLFRDGQLVPHPPAASGWIALDADGTARIDFTGVKLPTDGRTSGELTAYAFNEDWVKSVTAKQPYEVPRRARRRGPRAYVVSIGVDAYENSAWNLSYAADDAREMQRLLGLALGESTQYESVVRVELISSAEGGVEPTKERVRAVLDLLAGKAVAPELAASIPNAAELAAANPEDLVLITYSGHGIADAAGTFYVFPYDIGEGTERRVDESLYAAAISSDELSEWLRDVDAGELILIVDACQSAASVAQQGFRPGPMGSRGLGQLAYDKGMRVLAASQAEEVALESAQLKQGILTYALLEEGLRVGRANTAPPDEEITMSEWLAWGVQRVPALYAELANGSFVGARGFTESESSGGARSAVQQPQLFDFRRQTAPDVRLTERLWESHIRTGIF
jgi:uncharacterized caspase-like protein